MGSSLQEVLRRRGVTTGHGGRVGRVLPLVLLALLSVGIVLNLASSRPAIWFSLSLVSLAVTLGRSLLRRKKRHTLELFAACAVLLAGVIQLLGYRWLHLTYIPFVVVLSLFFAPPVVIPLSVLVPVLELRHFREGNPFEEALVSATVVVLGTTLSLVFSKVKRERDSARQSLVALDEEAAALSSGAGITQMTKESLLSEHLSSTQKANAEIQEVLALAQHALSADSVGLISVIGNELRLRCSTDESAPLNIPETGIRLCVKRREPLSFTTAPKGTLPAASHIVVPVVDGTIIIGVVTARNNGHTPFTSHHAKSLEMVSRQITGILHKQRISSVITREHAGLKILHEGSSSLLASLRMDVLGQNLIGAAYRIAPLPIAFFIARNDRFELVHQVGLVPPDETLFDVKDCLIGMAIRNGEPLYLSDVRDSRVPALPFKSALSGSVLVLPLLFEKELLGVLVFLSDRVDSLISHQIELLEVLGNQASLSLANARLHQEIERMAITDGLTGLYNHRHFQERLASEFRRLQRFSNPLSLLLIDIDFFKKINDTHGHPAGDEILRGVARIIQEMARTIDIPARYGGEEFALILLGTGHEGARKMAERLRKSVQDRKFAFDGKTVTITVSVGSATSPEDAENKELLIERADQALYHAKKNGRNRSVLWHDTGTH